MMRNRSGYILEETALSPAGTKAYEGAFTQGAGCLHLRASFEEGLEAAPQDEEYMRLPANVTIETPRHQRSKCGTYLAGITGSHPLLREELVNLPNPLLLVPRFEGEAYDADNSQTRGYLRRLDMRTGELSREFEWHTENGAVLACRYRRVVSRGIKNCIVQTVEYRLLQGSGTLTLQSGIDEKVRTNGYNHFTSLTKTAVEGRVCLQLQTDTGDRVHMLCGQQGKGLDFQPDADGHCSTTLAMSQGDTASICKITLLSGTNEGEEPESFDRLEARMAAAFAQPEQALYQDNAREWERLWQSCEVEIEGDDNAEKSVNFSLYHLLRCAHNNNRVAVCAKGFSGEAYFGHFFWDTEMYLLPFYLHTRPDTAQTLLDFRIRTLPGAQENARAYGYNGAKYPWESSVAGTEQCPNWQYADHEIHITADVAYGLWNYWQNTHDVDFLGRAVPVFLQTARFWLERVYWRQGRCHINGVMGPDEYVCLCNNNAYTNYMVRHSLLCTLQVLDILRRENPAAYNALGSALGAEESLLQDIAATAEGLRPAWLEQEGIIPQCDHFDELEEPRFEQMWPDRTKHYGSFVSQERNYRTKALKQADALMLPYLFPEEFSAARVEQNLAYYLPYTTHDSSLSAIIHSILFSRLGRQAEAYALFTSALDIDLDFARGGAAEGVHIANCGGIWQAVVYGFGGLARPLAGQPLEFAPKLPAHWRRLSFRLFREGALWQVEIDQDSKVSCKPVQEAAGGKDTVL